MDAAACRSQTRHTRSLRTSTRTNTSTRPIAAHSQRCERFPESTTALKKLLAVTGESAIRVIFTASAVKVTPTQCPDLYAKLQIACTTLGVDMPELFVQQNPIVNAFTGGVERPVIVLYSQLIERLS